MLSPFGVNVNIPSLAVAAVTFDLKVAVPSLSISVALTAASKILVPSISIKVNACVVPIAPLNVLVASVICNVPSVVALPLMVPVMVAVFAAAKIIFASPRLSSKTMVAVTSSLKVAVLSSSS